MSVGRRWLTGRGALPVCVALCVASSAASGLSANVPAAAPGEWPIKPPLPVWPSDYETITQRQPAFRFNGRFQADRYRVEVARDASFASPVALTQARVVDEGGIAPAFVAAYAGEPLQDGQYYWRAFAGNAEGFWTPAANYRTFFVASEDVDRIAVPGDIVHPRLILSARELDAFKRRVGRSLRLSPGWQYIQNAALSVLDSVPPDEAYARAAPGQHANYSVVAHWYHRHLANVGFVAFVNDDQRMAAKGVEMLMAACAYERWLGPLFDNPAHFNPPWNSALETAMMTTAVATGYDLFYHHLTEEQRARVREAIAEKGVRPLVADWADPVSASRLPRHQLPTGNWVMVCATSGGVGALSMLGEHPEAAEWVRLVRNRVRAWMHDRGGDWCADNPWIQNRPTPIPVTGPSEPNFGIDGGYKESVAYMNYAMRYVSCFADALRRTTGENLFEHVPANLLDQAAWSILAWPEDGEVRQSLIPFGDSGITPAFPLLYAALTRHRSDTLAAWLGERIVPIPYDVRALTWVDERVPGRGPDTAVPMGVFRDVGQVVMRNGWGSETSVAAIKFRQNRGHLDIGTFYLFGGGAPTVVDSGTTSYSSDIYKQYSSQTIGHNVVMVEGKAQRRVDGELLAAVGTSRLTAASGQLAAAYPDDLQAWTRDLIMLPGNVVVVLDRLAAHQPRRFDYILHPYPPFRIPDPQGSPGEILIGDEAKPTRIRVHSEQAFAASQPDGYYFSKPCKYVRLDSPEPTLTRTYFTVCEWPSKRPGGSQPLDVTAVRPGRWQLRSVGQDWRLIVRTGSDAGAADSNDARLVAVWDQGERSRERHALVLGGRRLGVDNRELMRTTQPVHAAIEFGRPLWAHFWTAQPTRVSLNAEPGADYVFLNGQRADVVRRGSAVSFDLPAGESTVVIGETPRFIPRPRALVSDDLAAVSVSVDAPAFQPGVVARASSFVPDALLALDGDANTGWMSLQGLPMPQWMEVSLPKPVSIASIRLETGGPCSGHVDLGEPGTDSYTRFGNFETTTQALAVTVDGTTFTTDRVRVVVESVEPGAPTATINTLEWSEAGASSPTSRPAVEIR